MRIVRAEAMGLCFGVRDALELALSLRNPEDVAIHGELVHNEVVVERLRTRGYASLTEAERRQAVPQRDRVMITAHGVSDTERERLERHGKQLVDTTCPLVRRAHRAALELSDHGWHVVVIGKPGHVEVEGLLGDLASAEVVATPADARRCPSTRIGVVCQTTCTQEAAREVLDAVVDANPGASIRFVDTTCEPTRQRVRAVEQLAQQCDAVVVVGGRNSNNTRQLVAIAAARGARAHHVQGPEDVDAAWFAPGEVVGLTAGTSTLDESIDAVERRLAEIAAGLRSASGSKIAGGRGR